MLCSDDNSAIYIASEDGLVAVIGYAVSSPRYVAGFADVTLLHGNASLNGYSMKMDETVSTRSTNWSPAVQLVISASNKTTKSSIPATKTKKFKNMLMKVCDDTTLINMFFESEVNAQFAACKAVIVLRGLSCEEQGWLMLAEGMNTRLQPWLGRMQRQELMRSNFVCTSSALVSDVGFMRQVGFDVTTIPPSWTSSSVDHLATFASRKGDAAAVTVVGTGGGGSDNVNVNANANANAYISNALSPRSIVCGAKGVGKSTLLRHMVNSYLSAPEHVSVVAVIDCDVGQPEFGVPGMMSLHIVNAPVCSPPHLHMREFPAELSFFLGEISTKHCPERFSAALRQLLDRYYTLRKEVEEGRRVYHSRRHPPAIQTQTDAGSSSSSSKTASTNMFALLNDKASYSTSASGAASASRESPGLPLIVNCDGNIRFMGSEILGAVVGIVSPTAVFHLSTDKDRILPAIHCSEELYHRHLQQQQRVQEESGPGSELDGAGAGAGAGTGSGVADKASPKRPPTPEASPPHTYTGALYPFELYTLEPGRTVQSRVAAVDLRNLRLAAYFLGDAASSGVDVKAAMDRGAPSYISAPALSSGFGNSSNYASTSSLDAYMPVGLRSNGGSVGSDLDAMAEDEPDAGGDITDGREGGASARQGISVSIKNGSLIDPNGVLALSMLALRPLSVPMSAVSLRSAVTDIPPRLLLAAVNASLVGILANDSVNNPPTVVRLGTASSTDGDATAGRGGGFACDLDCSSRFVLQPCVGVGIVRDVDLAARCLHVISPCAPQLLGSDLSFGNTDYSLHIPKGYKGRSIPNNYPGGSLNNCCLLKSNIALPIGLLFAPDFPSNNYLSSDVSGEGAAAMKHRNNVKRKRQSAGT